MNAAASFDNRRLDIVGYVFRALECVAFAWAGGGGGLGGTFLSIAYFFVFDPEAIRSGPVVSCSLFCSRFPYSATNPKKGILIIWFP